MSLTLEDIRFNQTHGQFTNLCSYEITGEDRESYLQGQTTNDVLALEEYEFQTNTRIDRSANLIASFYLCKLPHKYILLVHERTAEQCILDLQKFIIMEDVEIFKTNEKYFFSLNLLNDSSVPAELIKGKLFGEEACLSLDNEYYKNKTLSELDQFVTISLLNNSSWWSLDAHQENKIFETFLENEAVSYTKGCYLGQETVNKIKNGRGPSYFPTVLSLQKPVDPITANEVVSLENKKVGEFLTTLDVKDRNLILVRLHRDVRVIGTELNLEVNGNLYQSTIMPAPYFTENKSEELFHLGVESYQQNEKELAMNYLKKAIEFDGSYADAYETLGVIYGHQGKYERGIELMDKLLEVDSSSVMAHTNKSLFLMKLGKIEEAEEEKSLATVKTFRKFGDEAKLKNELTSAKEIKKQENLKRMSMFKQVLEIDDVDEVANFGMADIFLWEENYSQAIKHIDIVLDENKKFSRAYVIKGKSLEGLGRKKQAIDVYKEGITVAAKNGDLMPANEMSSLLVKLQKYDKLAKG